MTDRLFPAHAGVIPSAEEADTRVKAVPRTRGGDPLKPEQRIWPQNCSPHTRG